MPRLRKALQHVGDPAKALAMQTYTKSTMPYHGVPMPLLQRACKGVFADLPFDTASHWRAQGLDLWRYARFREERYAALYLAGDKRARSFRTPSAMKVYEEMVIAGAWWDCVDDIALRHTAHRRSRRARPGLDPGAETHNTRARCSKTWHCACGSVAVMLKTCFKTNSYKFLTTARNVWSIEALRCAHMRGYTCSPTGLRTCFPL